MLNGWCDACGSYVPVAEDWRCAKGGHDYTLVRCHYYALTGQPVAAPWMPEKITPVAAPGYGQTPGSREELILALASGIVAQPGFAVTFGTDCDLHVHMEEHFWNTHGLYDAKITLVDAERTVRGKEVLGYAMGPRFPMRRLSVGQYWGWPRELGFTSHVEWGNQTGSDGLGGGGYLVWHHGDTPQIVAQIAASRGWTSSWSCSL